MAHSIYKLWILKPTYAWHQLSEGERESLMVKVNDALELVGGKQVISCNSSWSSEQKQFFGVEEFPDIDAVKKHSELLNEFDWLQYIDSETLLGTASNT